MNALRTALRLLVLFTALATLPVLGWTALALQEEGARAQERYHAMAAQLDETTRDLRAVEGRLTRLSTSVAAVEEEARIQMRMVRPGERLVLISRPGQPIAAASASP